MCHRFKVSRFHKGPLEAVYEKASMFTPCLGDNGFTLFGTVTQYGAAHGAGDGVK